jgi:hypothetical protein
LDPNCNSCTRWRGILKILYQDEEGADFSKNRRATLFNDDLSNDSTVSQIHLA